MDQSMFMCFYACWTVIPTHLTLSAPTYQFGHRNSLPCLSYSSLPSHSVPNSLKFQLLDINLTSQYNKLFPGKREFWDPISWTRTPVYNLMQPRLSFLTSDPSAPTSLVLGFTEEKSFIKDKQKWSQFALRNFLERRNPKLPALQ